MRREGREPRTGSGRPDCHRPMNWDRPAQAPSPCSVTLSTTFRRVDERTGVRRLPRLAQDCDRPLSLRLRAGRRPGRHRHRDRDLGQRRPRRFESIHKLLHHGGTHYVGGPSRAQRSASSATRSSPATSSASVRRINSATLDRRRQALMAGRPFLSGRADRTDRRAGRLRGPTPWPASSSPASSATSAGRSPPTSRIGYLTVSTRTCRTAERVAADVPGVRHAHARARGPAARCGSRSRAGSTPTPQSPQPTSIGRTVADRLALELPQMRNFTWTARSA